jgi:hypothetical protein
MAKLYFNKIKNAEINQATGKVWVLADVPSLWQADVLSMMKKENLSKDGETREVVEK